MRLLAFDFDDVLAVTDSRVRLAGGERVSTADFRSGMALADDAFDDFAMPPKLVKAGPCAALLASAPKGTAAVVTARSAPSSVIAEFLKRSMAVEIDARYVYCVHSRDFAERFGVGPSVATAERKALALVDFASRFQCFSSLEYFDDDEENVRGIRNAIDDERVTVTHVPSRPQERAAQERRPASSASRRRAQDAR